MVPKGCEKKGKMPISQARITFALFLHLNIHMQTKAADFM